LLHRGPYWRYSNVEERKVYNQNKHLQRRANGAFVYLGCSLCRGKHMTKECERWPREPEDRLKYAGNHGICVRCLEPENGLCTAEEIVCGVNRCVLPHDPFFHEQVFHLTQGTEDAWDELQRRHSEARERRDAEVRPRHVETQHETALLLHRHCGLGRIETLFGTAISGLPGMNIRRHNSGAIMLTEADFGMLIGIYKEAHTVALGMAKQALSRAIQELPDAHQKILLKEELERMAGERGPMPAVQARADDTDTSLLSRQVRTELAYLRLTEAPTEEERESSSSSEESDPPDEDDQGPRFRFGLPPLRRGPGRPTFSGNPDEN
jgi:hypothetical protein